MVEIKFSVIIARISALVLFLVLLAWKTSAVRIVLNELTLFFSGGYYKIPAICGFNLNNILIIFITIILGYLCSLAVGIIQNIIFVTSREISDSLWDFIKKVRKGHYYSIFVFLVTICWEEIYARWFFLGLLIKISFLSGTLAFYLLFLIGNGIWTLNHLGNYKNGRKIFYVLTHFVSGFFYTYIFIKYGLFASITSHLFCNVLNLTIPFTKAEKAN